MKVLIGHVAKGTWSMQTAAPLGAGPPPATEQAKMSQAQSTCSVSVRMDG